VFIAGPVLTYWKEREPMYKARAARIRAEFGTIPPYAIATAGAPVDVAPSERERRRARVTQPTDPSRGVSRQEFDEMVRDLGVEEEERQPAATGSRPRGGRRARSRASGTDGSPKPPSSGGDGGSGGSSDKPKKPRNRRHGRPR
jgi:SecD/SecF fusion protein